ncbi:MAG: hypothetical protein Q7R81_03235 [Candidatus Peregrinibacteria bacterium]|nr:hypothetical protein [Candidatus Peregrinibacteria bacterium]
MPPPLDSDIPAGHDGNQMFIVLEIDVAGEPRRVAHFVGTIGECEETDVLVATLSRMPGLAVRELFTIRGLSEKAANTLENDFLHIVNRTGLTRSSVLQLLTADRQ